MSRPDRSCGQVLIEVLIALLIFSLISTAFMGGIFTSRTTTDTANELAAAESLTRVEMEYIKEAPYWSLGFSYDLPGSPPPWDSARTGLSEDYDSYSVSVDGRPIDTSDHQPLPSGLDQGMQQIDVQVSRGGELVLTTSTVKISR
jgi:type II secretory pathway pseudopilin PulG